MGLAAAGVVTLALAGVVMVRVISGAGPADSAASPLAAQREIDDAIRLAKQRLLEKRPADAEAILRDAVDRHGADPDLRIALGQALLTLNRPRDAYEQYNEAIGLSPDSAEMQYAAGTIASVAGMPERAEAHYQTAQAMAPGNPKYALGVGVIDLKLGKIDEARASLIRAVTLAPDLAVAWGALADLSLTENRLEMADHYVSKALALEPDSPHWRLIRARILRRRGEPEQAAVMLAALSDESSEPDPMILRERALCLGLLGRQKEAASLYDQACAIAHQDPSTLAKLNYEAALWHERLGETDLAARYAAAAVKLGDARAQRVVDRLAQGG